MGGWGRSGVFGAQPPVLHSLGLPAVDPSHPQEVFQRAARTIGRLAAGSPSFGPSAGPDAVLLAQ